MSEKDVAVNKFDRQILYDIIDEHVFATDEWGGSKLAGWQWGNNVVVDGIDGAVDALIEHLTVKE